MPFRAYVAICSRGELAVDMADWRTVPAAHVQLKWHHAAAAEAATMDQ